MTSRWEALQQGRVTIPANDEMGFTAVPVDDPAREVVFTWTVPERFCNSAGNLQGGLLGAFADAVLGASSAAHLAEDEYPSLASMSLSIFRPAPAGTRLTGRGRMLKAGKRVLFTEAEITDDEDRLVAKATGTAVPSKD